MEGSRAIVADARGRRLVKRHTNIQRDLLKKNKAQAEQTKAAAATAAGLRHRLLDGGGLRPQKVLRLSEKAKEAEKTKEQPKNRRPWLKDIMVQAGATRKRSEGGGLRPNPKTVLQRP